MKFCLTSLCVFTFHIVNSIGENLDSVINFLYIKEKKKQKTSHIDSLTCYILFLFVFACPLYYYGVSNNICIYFYEIKR